MNAHAWSSGESNLVVIVAGVEGAVLAREAALRGPRTLLVDERDLVNADEPHSYAGARPRPSRTAEFITGCDVPVSVDTGGRP